MNLFLDLGENFRELRAEIVTTVQRVLGGDWYILEPEVEAVAAIWATYRGAEHAFGVANGHDALALALRALEIGPGDGVIVPSNTNIATRLAVSVVGARLLPKQPDPETHDIDPSRIKAVILRVKLEHLNEWTDRHRAKARAYLLELSGSGSILPVVPNLAEPTGHLFVVRMRKPATVPSSKVEAGIDTVIHFPIPPRIPKACSCPGGSPDALSFTQPRADEDLSLPMGPQPGKGHIQTISRKLKNAA